MDIDIKEKRNELGISQWDLAESVGVSPETIRKWERGVTEPRKQNKEKLRTVLKDAKD